MVKFYRLLCVVLISGLLGLSSLSMADDGLPFPSFELRFDVAAKGITVGEAIITLQDEGNERYTMRSDVRPRGAVSLFSSQEVHQRVYGRFDKGAIRPLSYEQQRRKGDKNRTLNLSFDWQNQTVTAVKNQKREKILPLTPGIVDPLSLYLVTALDLANGKEVDEYTLAGDDRLKTYRIRQQGEETVRTSLGNLQTLRVSQQRHGSDDMTVLWFAPALNYLPVQIAKLKDGKETVRMTLGRVKGITLQ